jgi:hypothetical protein
MVPGESEVICAWDIPWQLTNIPLQVQPDNNNVRAAMRAIKEKGIQGEERILASTTRQTFYTRISGLIVWNPTRTRTPYKTPLHRQRLKDADPDIPILKQAKAENAKLQ